jgi:hypothetical protein
MIHFGGYLTQVEGAGGDTVKNLSLHRPTQRYHQGTGLSMSRRFVHSIYLRMTVNTCMNTDMYSSPTKPTRTVREVPSDRGEHGRNQQTVRDPRGTQEKTPHRRGAQPQTVCGAWITASTDHTP